MPTWFTASLTCNGERNVEWVFKRKINMNKFYKRATPVIVQRLIQPEVETKQHACIIAFTHGVADQSHFDTMLLEMNLLLVAGQTDKKRIYAKEFAYNEIKPTNRRITKGIREKQSVWIGSSIGSIG